MPALIWAHIHTTGPSGHIRYCLLPDPGTQAPKTSNFVDGAAATSPTTNEHGVVRVHERRGYLQRSSLWCEVEVKRNGEGESVTLNDGGTHDVQSKGEKRKRGRGVRAGPRTLDVGVSTPPEPACGVVPHSARWILV